ncbi:TonB-dependent hemoglobin/transferrin/lactoferrin family receptor [Pannonibacter indicus]|uniref:TonB-dependent hemoglobin/transferrin/lactoferrin family receptor n=1 Tax=Pannonibacter indicus TaxID=466044 RepID=UPI00391C5358
MTRGRSTAGFWLNGVALIALAYAGSANAQQATVTDKVTDKAENKPQAVTALQKIVLGTGQEKVAIDTPQAVTVIDQEQIDNAQATTIGDIFKQTPGVTMTGSDRIAGQSFNIRGIGDLGSADESKIIITVDGANKFFEMYRMGSFFSDPELYKRVEILRGPASSTLYGAGALGGVINFETKDASDFLEDGETVAVRLKTSFDSNKSGLMTSAIAAMKLGPDTEALLNGNFRRSDDYETGNGTRITGSAFDSFSGLAKVTHYFGDGKEQSLRISYERWQSDADNTAYSQTGTLDTFGRIDRDITDQTVVVRYENPAAGNPFLNMKVNLSLSDTKVAQKNANVAASIAARSPDLFRDADYGYRTWQAKAENTFEFKGESWENYLTAGTQLSYQERIAGTNGGSGWVDFHPEGTDTKIGVFAQNEFIWNDRLTITPGMRLDYVTVRPDSVIPNASTQTDYAFSPKLAALYKFTDSFSVFGSVARTERLPTLDELFSTGAPSSTYPGGRTVSLDLKKEESFNYEAGFAVSRQDLFLDNDSIALKTTGFYNDLTNLITTGPQRQASAVPYYVNAHSAHIYGVELEAAYDSRYVFASAAYSWTRGKNDTTNAALTTIPAETVAVTLGGRIPDYNVNFGWRAEFTGSADAGATTGPFPGYALHDAFVNWKLDEGQFKGLELRAAVENIFDKRYRNNLSGDDGKGRTFKLSVNKKFGW